ncbi:hypothetical protein [Arthrobacter cupressi]
MSVTAVIKKNSYFDSVSLMSISTKANGLDGVGQAFVAMATEMNKGVLQNLGLLTPELAEAGNGDLMIVVVPAPGADAEAVIPQIEELLTRRAPAGGGAAISYRTIAAAAQADPGANLAIIAVNGAYAAREARKALDNGLNVMMFSDNVPVEEEIALKALAHGKGLLMMGPDCGTAIINNVALCFGNAVRPGPVGVVAASGTGSQEVSVRIHALAADPKTEAIVLVSKPPAPEVEKKVLAEIAGAGKPVVVYFIGGSEEAVTTAGGTFAASSLDAALAAVRLTGLPSAQAPATDTAHIESVRARLTPEQTNIRGLFCGGTLCDESMYALLNAGEEVWSNIQKDPEFVLGAADPSRGHTFLDFGDDEFTNGRPHPMIDPSNRLARLVEEAKDPSVAAIVMDFVLGFGAHEDPVGVTLPAITEARNIAADAGRHLEIVAYVLGTDRDTPGLAAQTAALVAAGVTITTSSTATGEFARAIVREGIKA